MGLTKSNTKNQQHGLEQGNKSNMILDIKQDIETAAMRRQVQIKT
jgi:hypothetical protein